MIFWESVDSVKLFLHSLSITFTGATLIPNLKLNHGSKLIISMYLSMRISSFLVTDCQDRKPSSSLNVTVALITLRAQILRIH